MRSVQLIFEVAYVIHTIYLHAPGQHTVLGKYGGLVDVAAATYTSKGIGPLPGHPCFSHGSDVQK
jgi:hypothetical protein